MSPTESNLAESPRKREVCEIRSRLELFVDDWLIDKMNGAQQRLHHPIPREVALVFDRPWEGNTSAYATVFQDEDVFRMYYRGSHYDWAGKRETHSVTCMAESPDGVHWTRPDLGLFEFGGSKSNNIVWVGEGTHNFAPFKDANPGCGEASRYKALAGMRGGLAALHSPDGIHWSLVRPEPVITEGAFDSLNLAFWDTFRARYVEFHRNFRDGVRDIMTCTSQDFVHWTDPVFVDFGELPREHLYTSSAIAYFRAPHLFLGFPKRFLPERKKIQEHGYPGVSDGVFMSSRDGYRWNRWLEAFIRPGLQRERWWERNNMTAWGVLVTKPEIPGLPDELSLYSSESYYEEGCRLRRYTIRMDGFVSIFGPYAGGEFLTRPLVFSGHCLILNYSTSAAGSIRVGLEDGTGRPFQGYRLDDCEPIFGDEIEHTVRWTAGSDLSQIAGSTVRLRFVLRDADLYSIQFR